MELIEDSYTINVTKLVVQLFAEEISDELEKVIAQGTGVGQPTGFASGGLGISCQSVAGNLSFSDIIDLIYNLPSKYRKKGNAKFYMNTANTKELRKLQDSNNRYLWLDNLVPTQPSTIYGYPVIETNWLSESEIYFGDLRRAYYLGEKGKMRVKITQDESQAFQKDQTAVRVVLRVAGTVVLADALKCLNSIP